MLDRVTSMEIFWRTARAGSLSAAARQMNLSPTMATKHVDALELRLGVRLLQRSTRRLTLTEAGQQYLEMCARLLPELEETEALIAAQRIEVSGLLRLNVPLSFGVRYIAPLLPAFHERHPGVNVELGLNDRVVDLLEEGWDLTIRVGHLKDSRLLARKLADSAMVVCAAPDYWQRRGRPTFWAELGDHNCLSFMLSPLSWPNAWRFGKQADQSVPIKGPLRTNNGDALVAAAAAGMGVLYEPDFIVADALRAGSLEAVILDEPAANVGGIHLLRSADRKPPAKVRAMTDFLVETFAQGAPWQ
ncbi:LysR family transcriptional regulator [Sodalis ligni]|uniref:LysR family transcriptional regulator n=1 Tax=Sodalis ligni TaxID=2697027 RepID=UPI00193FA6E7|nr:LysR family transcriptional regulator [Sodalis ligni]QWA11970.1 LysR family transcriptional regulator [Sodalis ligni]